MKYDNLHKSYKLPKNKLNEIFFSNVKRIPRKLRKQIKNNKSMTMYYKSIKQDLGKMLWFYQHLINPNYNRFIIQQICNLYNSKKYDN